MDVTAATFTDPAMRPQLEAYYDNKKAELLEALKARGPMPEEVKFTTSDGETHIAKALNISPEKMVNSLVSFDKWLEFQASSERLPQQSLDIAQKRLDNLTENGPDTSSHVRTTFSDKGVMLAYINDDGTFVTSNAAAPRLQALAKKADDMGLSGQSRLDYLNRAFKDALAEDHKGLQVANYTSATAPTKREFAQAWYPNYDADRQYQDTLADAKASLDDAKAWHQQWQNNMNDIRNFLLGLQQAA